MEFLEDEQLEIGRQIKNILDKLNEKELRKRSSVVQRDVQDLNTLWNHFEHNHDKIKALDITSHPYIILNFHQQVYQAKEEISRILDMEVDSQWNMIPLEEESTNRATVESDSIFKIIESRNMEIEKKTTESQLKQAIQAKCEALAKINVTQNTEVTLYLKEKLMAEDCAKLTNQIQTLSQDLNHNVAASQTIRLDNAIRILELTMQLYSKIDEVEIANSQISDLNKIVGSLTNRAEELATKLLQQDEEYNKRIEQLNKSVRDKVERIRQLVEKLYDTEKKLTQLAFKFRPLEAEYARINRMNWTNYLPHMNLNFPTNNQHRVDLVVNELETALHNYLSILHEHN